MEWNRIMAASPEVGARGGHRRGMSEAAFCRFYEQTASQLFRYLLRVSGRKDLAEDTLQEAYCRFLSADLPAMDASQSKSYLFRIASNLLRDRWRRHEEDPLPLSPPQIASTAPQFNRQLEMRQAFGRLKLRERQLLWFAYVQGSTHKEIAQAMGLRAGSVRLLLFRARRRLAQLIGARHPISDLEILK